MATFGFREQIQMFFYQNAMKRFFKSSFFSPSCRRISVAMTALERWLMFTENLTTWLLLLQILNRDLQLRFQSNCKLAVCGGVAVRVSAYETRGSRFESFSNPFITKDFFGSNFPFCSTLRGRAYSLILPSITTCLVVARSFLPLLPSSLVNLKVIVTACNYYLLASPTFCSINPVWMNFQVRASCVQKKN